MIGAYADHARQFLLVFAIATTLVFALPIFLFPLAWGRVMRFRIPSDTDLAVYFGRCLGALLLVLEGLTFRAALTGAAVLVTFQIIIAACALMILVHVYGAVKRIQPITETIEIGVWILLLFLGLAFYPVSASS